MSCLQKKRTRVLQIISSRYVKRIARSCCWSILFIKGRSGSFLYYLTFRLSDTPRSKATGVLPSSSPLARSGPTRASRGGLSRSVLYARWSTRFRMPYGTVYCLLQDVVK